MTWQIVFVVICVIVAGVAALFWRLPSDDTTRSRAKTVTIAAVAAAAVFFFLGCFTIVGTRQFAIMTTFGRPTGVSLNNGFHGKWPWQMTHPMDGAVQIDKYVKEGNTDQRITVRLGNQSTALADVSIRWQLKQAAAPELFQQYKTFDNVRVNLIERNLSVALNEVFAGFNPLDPRNLDVSPLPSLAKRAADILRQDVGGQVDIFDVNVPTIQYDQRPRTRSTSSTSSARRPRSPWKHSELPRPRPRPTRSCPARSATTPTWWCRTALRPRSTRESARWVAGREAQRYPPSQCRDGNRED